MMKLAITLALVIPVVYGTDPDMREQELQFELKNNIAQSSSSTLTDEDSNNIDKLTLWSVDNFPDINSQECHSNEGQYEGVKVCDPDKILRKFEYEKIEEVMNIFQYFTVRCLEKDEYKLSLDEEYISEEMINDEEEEDSEHKVPIELSVVIMRKMKIPYGMDEETVSKDFAMSLHDKWGIGSTLPSTCNDAGTGILVLISLYDRVVFVSRGGALETTLNDGVIDEIIEVMGKEFRQGLYGRGTKLGLLRMISYLEIGPPSNWDYFFKFCERYAQFIFMIGATLYRYFSDKWQRKEDMEYARLRTELSRLDRDNALSLQGKYECTSCPICLENFQGVNKNQTQSNDEDEPSNDTNQTKVSCKFVPTTGSDGLPLKLLRCGHVFDETCWSEYVSAKDGDVHVCPICKQDLAPNPAQESTPSSFSSMDTTTQDQNINEEQELRQRTNSSVVQDEVQNVNTNATADTNTNTNANNSITNTNTDVYQNERNFRLSRLQLRYPRYISRITLRRWVRQDYSRGSLLTRDRDFLQRNPTTRTTTTPRSQSSSFSRSMRSFGSGRSSGGRGRRW